ncbi:Vacuolar calcium ion transporter, partial [Diplodia intermedia]
MLLNALAVGSAAFMTSALSEDLVSGMPGSSLVADMLFSNVAWLCVGIFALGNKQYQTIAFIIPGSILTRGLLGLGLALISGSLSQRTDHDNAHTMALYSSLKIAGLVPFFLCSLLALAFRDDDDDDDVPRSPDSRDRILLFSHGSAVVSLSCYLLLHLFLNTTHTQQPVSPAPPTLPDAAAGRTLTAAPPPAHPARTALAFLATLLATVLASRNLVHALDVPLPAFPPASTTAPAFSHAILLPLLINHAELLAAIGAPHLHQQNPHHVLAVLTEAPTAHATLALVPSLVLLGWIFGGHDLGMEIGRGGRAGGEPFS